MNMVKFRITVTSALNVKYTGVTTKSMRLLVLQGTDTNIYRSVIAASTW